MCVILLHIAECFLTSGCNKRAGGNCCRPIYRRWRCCDYSRRLYTYRRYESNKWHSRRPGTVTDWRQVSSSFFMDGWWCGVAFPMRSHELTKVTLHQLIIYSIDDFLYIYAHRFINIKAFVLKVSMVMMIQHISCVIKKTSTSNQTFPSTQMPFDIGSGWKVTKILNYPSKIV